MIPKTSRIILCWHDISETDSPQHSNLYSTEPIRFFQQINFLEQYFKFCSLDEINSNIKNEKPLLAITFDDGFLSVKNIAMQFLTQKKIPFAIFLNKMAIIDNHLPYTNIKITKSKNNQIYLNENDIKEIYNIGATIGSHTLSHKILADCDEDMLKEQIYDNKDYLENLINDDIYHFAIPYGKKEHYNKSSIKYCEIIGHKFIYTTNPTYFKKDSSKQSSTSMNLIPRIGITNETPNQLLFYFNRPLFKKINI